MIKMSFEATDGWINPNPVLGSQQPSERIGRHELDIGEQEAKYIRELLY